MLLGRIQSFRTAGPKLVFVDIIQDNYKVQGVCKLAELDHSVSIQDFSSFNHMLRKGDAFSETPWEILL
jgi:lysyl-tRNA synthetase class II